MRSDATSKSFTRRNAARGVSFGSKVLKEHLLPGFIREKNCTNYWNPEVRVCIVASWEQGSTRATSCASGWHSRYLSGDSCSGGYAGDDGLRHRGFLESLRLGSEDCRLRDRYEGVEFMFEELDD